MPDATPPRVFNRCILRSSRIVIGSVLALVAGCQPVDRRTVITLWHQMPPAERSVLAEQLAHFEERHPAIRVRTLYKETEELRSGFQAAALAGTGPDLVYGPSDALGAFQTMGIVRDMTPWFPPAIRDRFVPGALTFLLADDGKQALVQVGDRVGNHLTLVYNRRLVAHPPATTDDLIRLARANTVDLDGDGRTDRYGIVWNFVEPFFVVPFLTGYDAWLFADAAQITPRARHVRVCRGVSFRAVASGRIPRHSEKLRLRNSRLALQDGQGGHDHQWRLELGRLPGEQCHRCGDRPASHRIGNGTPHASAGGHQRLFAQRGLDAEPSRGIGRTGALYDVARCSAGFHARTEDIARPKGITAGSLAQE